MATVSQTICSNAFSWKYLNWQYVSIGSDNGLIPSRRQAIIWTNADPVQCRIYAALGGDELIFVSLFLYLVHSRRQRIKHHEKLTSNFSNKTCVIVWCLTYRLLHQNNIVADYDVCENVIVRNNQNITYFTKPLFMKILLCGYAE